MALVARLHDVTVVREAVEQGGRHLRVAEHRRPFGEVQVGGDHHAGVLVQLGQQVEQQRAAGLAERQVAQFVQDHQIHSQQAQRNTPGLALGLLLLQCIDQIDRRVEPHALAVAHDARHAQSRCQMGLACAWTTDQDHVVRGLGELQHRELVDQLLVDHRRVEVEAGQIPVHGEARRVHLVLDRTHRTVCGLRLQQVLDQPARGVQAGRCTLLRQIAPGTGHAMQAQRLEFDCHVTHGPPPVHAGCRSVPCWPAAA
ncbi:hypothetical protein D9M72_403730 [compost metagenome]